MHWLTTYMWITLIASVLLLAACTGLLFFLWFGVNTPSWKRLILANWFSRVVTLDTLAVRVAIGAQGGVATSMVAALIMVSQS